MAFGSNPEGEMMSEINVTPLVDVMLVLLVVFIITAPLLSPQSLKISLPKADAGQNNQKLEQVSLIVDARGNIELESRHISDEALVETLRGMSHTSHFQLQILADKSVAYGRIAELMALAQNAGVEKLAFVTLKK